MLERFLIVWLCVLSLLAYAWPGLVPPTWGDPFSASAAALWGLIFAAMFSLGWLLPRDEFRHVVARWPSVLAGTGVQYTTMPLLAYGLGRLLRLDEASMIGLIMAGCVPGAMASNLLTLVARGNVSYSLSLTTTATLLSPLVVPWVLGWLLGQQHIDFPALETSRRLAFFVVLPVVVGHLLSRWLGEARRASRFFARTAATVAHAAILWIIAVVVGLNRERLAAIEPRLLVGLVGLNLGGYAAGWLGGRLLRLPSAMRRALTLEVGMQNAGLGATLAATLFAHQPETAIGPAMYTFGCMFTGTVLAKLWANSPVNSAAAPGISLEGSPSLAPSTDDAVGRSPLT